MIGNFGFIHEKLEIKVLILFILRRLQDPISLDVLTELTMCDDGISYFDFTECVAELAQTKHIKLVQGMYSVTDKGVRDGKTTENSLPYSVRAKVEESTSALRAAQSRNSLLKTSWAANPGGGCTLSLSLSDGVGEIVSMSLFAANERQAVDLENNFRENPVGIYHSLIELITRKGDPP